MLVGVSRLVYISTKKPQMTREKGGTYSISTNNPFASVPVKRSSTAPPGLTLRNHLNRCRVPSGMREVIGYAEVICQSWTERDTSNYHQYPLSLSLPIALSYAKCQRKRRTHASFLGKDEINLRSNRPWSKDESSSILIMYSIYHSAESLLVNQEVHLVRTSLGPN